MDTQRLSYVPFARRLGPAPVDGGFRMDGWWVWCGSVARGEDGRYHMFAARWPKHLPFFEGYQRYSEVVRAVADTPAGPFAFAEVVLPDRGEQHWDGRMTHNPTVLRHEGRWWLFYIGATFPGRKPTAEELHRGTEGPWSGAYDTIRIGLATADSITGPWQRREQPVLDIRPDRWDSTVTTNPAPCLCPDGGLLLYYRSNYRLGGERKGCRIGLAAADRPEGPYRRVVDEPILPDCRVEDPFVWWAGDHYEMVAKDLTGAITGEFHAGVHALSRDGVSWQLADEPKAWSRTIRWSDGRCTTQGSLERPQLLREGGEPTWLYAATADGPGGFRQADNTWNLAIPLGREGA